MNFFKYTEKKCAKEIIKIINKLLKDSNPVYEPDRNQVRYGEKGFVYLGNIYNKAQSLSKSERLEYLESFLTSAFNQEDISYEASANQLVPRIKTKAEISLRNLYTQQTEEKTQSWLTYDFTDAFVIELGIDTDNSVRIVDEATLKDLTLTKNEAMAIAMKNLFSISNNIFDEVKKGLYLCRYNDDHDAARVLMTDIISKLDVVGQPVAFIPAANVLIICGSEDFDLLNNMQPYMSKLSENGRPLSWLPLILVDGVWRDFVPEKSDQYASIYNLISYESLLKYEEQKEQLEALNIDNGIDIFVSSYMLMENQNSPFYHSTTTWSESIPTWLPIADTISFNTFENDEATFIGQANFNDVLDKFGDLMQPLGYTPERYLVTDFPNLSQLKEILIKA